MSKGVAVEFQKVKLSNMFKECLYYFSKLKKPNNKTNKPEKTELSYVQFS